MHFNRKTLWRLECYMNQNLSIRRNVLLGVVGVIKVIIVPCEMSLGSTKESQTSGTRNAAHTQARRETINHIKILNFHVWERPGSC